MLVRQPVVIPEIVPRKCSDSRLKFLTYYDFDSFITRKNIKAPIVAFQKAFPSQQDVSITVKARGKEDHGAREWLKAQAASDARIKIIDKTVSRTDIDRLVMECDAFISLHRSEDLDLVPRKHSRLARRLSPRITLGQQILSRQRQDIRSVMN